MTDIPDRIILTIHVDTPDGYDNRTLKYEYLRSKPVREHAEEMRAILRLKAYDCFHQIDGEHCGGCNVGKILDTIEEEEG